MVLFYLILDAAKKDWIIICAGNDNENPGLPQTDSKNQEKLNNEEEKEENNDENEENIETKQAKFDSKTIKLDDLEFNPKKNYIIILRNLNNNFMNCHYKLYIPPLLDEKMIKRHPFDYIDSLNSSVILGLILTKFKMKN